ncbi:MAG: hypothetical protein GC131_03095 [Alphaproteobacteria bacterium]|nr:hypothetical protein [Alphaproteobacteria bacterium]
MNRSTLMRALMGVIVVAGALGILDIWFDIFSREVFGKFLLTCIIVAGVIAAVLAIRNDIDDEDRKKKDGYLN